MKKTILIYFIVCPFFSFGQINLFSSFEAEYNSFTNNPEKTIALEIDQEKLILNIYE